MASDDLAGLNFSSNLRASFKNIDKLRKELQKGKSAQEVLNISNKAMSQLHQAARRLLEGGKFTDAANAFLFLATLNPKEGDYWMGLGDALSKSGDLDSAKDAFELATLCGGGDPLPYLHLAKILFSLNDREATLEALELTLQMAGDDKKYAAIRKEAEKAKKILENR